MKKIISLILIIISYSTFAQNCNIGNEKSTGFNNLGDPFYKDYLLGVKFNLSTSGMLTSLNLIGRNTGAEVELALYEDIAGVPGNLVISTAATTVGTGIISIPVTPTPLVAGNYWIMGIYNNDGGHTYNKYVSENIVYFKNLTFGNTIPPNGSDFFPYTGSDFTYYAEITCGTLGTSDIDDLANVSFSPNPTSDILYIKSSLDIEQLYLFDLNGKLVLSQSKTKQISIKNLPKGMYVLKVKDNSGKIYTKQVIKE